MGFVTFQVLDGLEKGRVFHLPTPFTIGREDENLIRLNDERVSRFHAKVQEDNGRIILTDLDSTNGTRVNGHPVQMRVLQYGDQLALGRSLLIFGSPEELAQRCKESLNRGGRTPVREHQTIAISDSQLGAASDAEIDFEPPVEAFDEDSDELFPNGPPELPCGLRPLQAAQISDLLAYFHREIAQVVLAAQEENSDGIAPMRVDFLTWQRLLKLEMSLANYLRQIADPNC